jgi:hypothetical protein
VLDLRWKRGKLLLCSSCTFIMSSIVIANERQGVGPAFDLFIGKPGSVVETFNCYRYGVGEGGHCGIACLFAIIFVCIECGLCLACNSVAKVNIF